MKVGDLVFYNLRHCGTTGVGTVIDILDSIQLQMAVTVEVYWIEEVGSTDGERVESAYLSELMPIGSKLLNIYKLLYV
jgi:hypothetical protein